MSEYTVENGLKFPTLTAFDQAGAQLMPSTRAIIGSVS